MTTITTNLFRADADQDALWQHYSGQQRPQDVFASLDLRDGEWTIDYEGSIGGTPESVWAGNVLRFPLDAIPTRDGANRLMERTAALAQAVLDAHAADNDGPRSIWEDDAPSRWQQNVDAAEKALREALADIPDADRIDVWTVDALEATEWDGITADMTDQDVESYADELLSDLAANSGAGLAVCDGLYESLIEERDSKRGDA